ncbi:hypothetical protein DMA12_45680 [Amycolatopsis balhimycina DSM 5908]|uniref:Uncharacterized protein n=1 Tax=Amycolatopsis balhimycina DSM 5908 TaxID=1081091 RepID=A0A428VW52_AMYBA|nr:hypothetical protein DMA12_45680 [Amycolatopsis balhimycina DSM 5908]
MIMRRELARSAFDGRRLEWLVAIAAGGLALMLWTLLDSAWPWVLALGVLLLAALVGVRRPGAPAAGLVAADVWWLLSVPWWGWCLVVGVVLVAVAAWWALALYRVRLVGRAVAGRSPAQPLVHVPAAGPAEQTAPIPRISARPGLPGWRGRPVRRWHPIAAAAAGVLVLTVGIVGQQLAAAELADRRQAELDQAHQEAFSRIMPHSAASFVQAMIKSIAERQPAVACAILTPPARRDFAAAHGADACEHAVDALSRQVPNGDGVAYENAALLPLPGSATEYGPAGKWLRVDACALSIDPPTAGPTSLGIFQLELTAGGGGGYQATGYTRCL